MTLATNFNEFFVEKVVKIQQSFPQQPSSLSSEEISASSQTEQDYKYLHDFEPATVEEIKDIIKQSGINCAPTDFLPSDLLKQHVDIFYHVLCKIVNLSLSTGSINGLKIADIIPDLKDSGLDPNKLGNYRPISNLSFLGKLIERVVLKRLINEHMLDRKSVV